jgi:predicted SnoaL-like aldol condensation-catalyzing enzyme
MSNTKIDINQEKKEKEIAQKFFSLLNPDKIEEARSLFAPKCKHHNPYIAPGMDALLDGIMKVQKEGAADMPTDGRFYIKHVIADGDLVAVHTTLESKSNMSKGIRQIHLFRFSGDKIVEYWDVTQQAPADAPYIPSMF